MTELLVRHLFESTLFCLIMAGLALCLRPQSSALRYTLWLVGVAKFAVPAAVLKAAGAQLAFLVPASAWMSLAASKLSALLTVFFGFLPANMAMNETTVTHDVLVSLWLFGSAAMFGRWLTRLRQRSSSVTEPTALEVRALRRACSRFGISRPPRLGLTGSGVEPSLRGILYPTLTVPRDLAGQLDQDEFESILLHELAHARRWDNLASMFVHTTVCVFWFHPLLWFAQRRINQERERACDQAVVRAGVPRESYIAGMMKACRLQVFGNVAGVSGITSSDLGMRLQLVLSYRRRKRVFTVLPRLLLAMFAASMTLLPMAGGYCEQCVSQNMQARTPASH